MHYESMGGKVQTFINAVKRSCFTIDLATNAKTIDTLTTAMETFVTAFQKNKEKKFPQGPLMDAD